MITQRINISIYCEWLSNNNRFIINLSQLGVYLRNFINVNNKSQTSTPSIPEFIERLTVRRSFNRLGTQLCDTEDSYLDQNGRYVNNS